MEIRKVLLALQFTGEWAHIAMIYDGSDFKIFVNGEEENNTSITGEIASGNRSLILRALAFAPPFHFRLDGLLDEIFIYDRALSEVTPKNWSKGALKCLKTVSITTNLSNHELL